MSKSTPRQLFGSGGHNCCEQEERLRNSGPSIRFIGMKSLLHLVKFMLGLDSAASQVTDRELQMLLRYSRDARTICEIGCYEASTSVALALNTTGTVYSIDPFYRGRLGVCYGEYVARVHRWRNGVQNLVFLKGLSHEVGRTFDLSIDFLFIDADHSYEAVK